MKQTDNYNLSLYEPNDLANLTDGYNDSMLKLDTDLKAVEGFVQSYDAMIEQNASDIVTEKNRATAAEKVNADSILVNANAIKTNAESISAETKRAQTAESELATGVSNAIQAASAVSSKFPVNTENIAANAVTKDKLDIALGATYKILTIGDSYGEAEVDANTWTWQLSKMMPNSTFYNYAVSGGGFTASFTFLKQLQKAAAEIDVNEITHVVIAGGRNDIYSTSYSASVSECLAYAVNTFSNALVIVVPMLWDYSTITTNELNKASTIATAAAANKCDVLNYAWIWNKGIKDYYQSDLIHPNSSGATSIAAYIRNGILGTYMPRFVTAEHSLGSEGVMRFTIVGGVCFMTLQGNTGSSTKTTFPTAFSPISTVSGIAYYNSGNNFCVTFVSNNGKDKDPDFSLFGITSSTGSGCSMSWLV